MTKRPRPNLENTAQALRERLAQRRSESPEATSVPVPSAPMARVVAHEPTPEVGHFGELTSVEEINATIPITILPVSQIGVNLDPSEEQAREVPLPDNLLGVSDDDPVLGEIAASLREIGRSMQDRQLQPIWVYPGRSEAYPQARYIIVFGRRRWTAATLVGMETIEARIVERPSAIQRVLWQNDENIKREQLSDMEVVRGWMQLKQVLEEQLGQEVAWRVIEEKFGVTEARRQQLTRLLRFSPAQQQRIIRLRLQETQARPLHAALRNGELTEEQVDQVLDRLEAIARGRYQVQRQNAFSDVMNDTATPRETGIERAVVQREVNRVQASAQHIPDVPATMWVPTFRSVTSKARRSVRKALSLVGEDLDDAERHAIESDLTSLRDEVEQLLERIRNS